MARNVSSIKKTPTGPGNLIKRILAVMFSVLVIAVSYLYLSNADRAARDTVSIVQIRSADLPAFTVITSDNVQRHDIIRAEFDGSENGMILYEDVERIYGMMAAYYIRGNTFLYRDQLVRERPLRNEWLYELHEDYEIMTIPFNHMEAGGNILLPGDRIRVRAIIEDTDESDPYDPWDTDTNVTTSGGRVYRTELLFDSIFVTDMLNADAASIFEIYNEVIRLSEAERAEVMNSSDFKARTRPRALVLAGTREQVDEYALFRASVGTGSFVITILSRSHSRVILDQLPAFGSGVGSW